MVTAALIWNICRSGALSPLLSPLIVSKLAPGPLMVKLRVKLVLTVPGMRITAGYEGKAKVIKSLLPARDNAYVNDPGNPSFSARVTR